MKDKDRTQKVMDLIGQAIRINTLENRSRKKTGNKPTVFFEFSGHVSILSIRVYKDGWSKNADMEGKDLYIGKNNNNFDSDYTKIKAWLDEIEHF